MKIKLNAKASASCHLASVMHRMNFAMVLCVLVLCDFAWNETRWLMSGQSAMTDVVHDARSHLQARPFSKDLFDFMP